MTQEGRHAVRVKPEPGAPIEIHLMGEEFLDIFEARDISTSGVGIIVPHRFEGCDLRSPVRLVMTLPGGKPFLAKGRIIHRSRLDREFFGVQFIDLGEIEHAQIAQYVSERFWSDHAGD